MYRASADGQSLLDIVLKFLQEDQWNYQKLEKKTAVRAGYRGVHGTWVCYARFDSDETRFSFQSLMGLNIPPRFRMRVVDYLNRANSLLDEGKFEMDLDSGDVHFKTAVDLSDRTLTVEKVREIAYYNVNMMDHYFPGVLAVVYGGLTPHEALKRLDVSPVREVEFSDRMH